MPLADRSEGRIFAGMADILESALGTTKSQNWSSERHLMCLYGPFGPRLRAPIRKNSSRDPLRKRCRIGSIAPVKLGLKNAGENAMPDPRKRPRNLVVS